MKPAPQQPSLLGRLRTSQPVVAFITSIWLVVVMQYAFPMMLFLPLLCIPWVGKTLFRHVTGTYDKWARLSCMAIPFSWCGFKIWFNDYPCFEKLKANGNALLLSSHCSRVDWLIGMYLGCLDSHVARVGFVAEATTALMPVIGWSRLLLGDIFVTRAFDKDAARILSNIRTFHRSGIERLIFFAPEGFIADPDTAVGTKYIEDCETFMKSMGREPMQYVLTPRYKGMQHFVRAQHALGSVSLSLSLSLSCDARLDAYAWSARRRAFPLLQILFDSLFDSLRFPTPRRAHR